MYCCKFSSAVTAAEGAPLLHSMSNAPPASILVKGPTGRCSVTTCPFPRMPPISQAANPRATRESVAKLTFFIVNDWMRRRAGSDSKICCGGGLAWSGSDRQFHGLGKHVTDIKLNQVVSRG